MARKFIYNKSASVMLIKPGIVFIFTRQKWSSATFNSYLTLLMWVKYTQYTSANYFLLLPQYA